MKTRFYAFLALLLCGSISPMIGSAQEERRCDVRGRVFTVSPAPAFQLSRWTLQHAPEDRPAAGANFQLGDFDGDGRSDLAYFSESGAVLVARSDGKGAFAAAAWGRFSGPVRSGEFHAAYLNRDRFEDLLGCSAADNSCWTAVSNGAGGFYFQKLSVLPPDFRFEKLDIADMNGDGLDDVIAAAKNSIRIVQVKDKPAAESASMPSFVESLVFDWPAGFQFAGAGNVTGDEFAEVFAYSPKRRDVHVFLHFCTPLPPAFVPWADFSRDFSVQVLLKGDFNGDGLTDLLVRDTNLMGWWTALSNRVTGLERPVKGLPKEFSLRQDPLVGDVDGDGLDDVVFPEEGDSIAVSMSRLSLPVQGVTIQAGSDQGGGGQTAVTDQTGLFELKNIEDRGLRLSCSHPDFVCEVPVRMLSGACFSDHRASFISLPRPKPGDPVGQAVRLGPDAPGPYVCTGYNPGNETKWGDEPDHCPPGYAYYSADDSGGKRRSSEFAMMNGTCCRLPLPDILTEEETVVTAECPDSFVAVGAKSDWNCEDCTQFLLCRKINLERYRLGPLTPGLYWGVGFSMRSGDSFRDRTEIPLGIREGLEHFSPRQTGSDGCIGLPYGSLLVRKGRRCFQQGYRELQYRGAPGDPPAGTPVKMFPNCKRLVNVFDPTAGCYE